MLFLPDSFIGIRFFGLLSLSYDVTACAELRRAASVVQFVAVEYPARALGLSAELGVCAEDQAMVTSLGGVILGENAESFTAEFVASDCMNNPLWADKVRQVQAFRALVPSNTGLRDVNIASQTQLSRLAARSFLADVVGEPSTEADTRERECSCIVTALLVLFLTFVCLCFEIIL